MPKTRKPPFLVWAGILSIGFILVFSTGCLSAAKVKEKYATSDFYFDTENFMYQYLIDYYGDIWNGGKSILEINEPALKLAHIINASPLSFTTANMPLDMKGFLKSYRPEDVSYTDYYDFITRNADRIIFCQKMDRIMGLSVGVYKDTWPYPGENVIYIDAYDLKNYLLSAKYKLAARIIVHEAAHKEVRRLIEEDKIPSQYGRNELTERHAIVREVEFLKITGWRDEGEKARLGDYNIKMGLSEDDMTLFVSKEEAIQRSNRYSGLVR